MQLYKNDDKKRNILYLFMYICVFIGFAGYLFYYLITACGRLPLMDYWKGGSRYLNHILHEPFNLKDIIPIPHQIHWNVLSNLLDYLFVRWFKCDNYGYVFGGMLMVCVITIVMIMYYNRIFKCNNIILDCCGVIACIIPIYNLNQWEILTLYCSVFFMLRICLYIAMWTWLDRLMKEEGHICHAIAFGVLSFLIVMFASQAYYPGFSAAICGAILFNVIINKKISKPQIIIFVSQIVSVAICFMTTALPNVVGENSITLSVMLKDYFRGFLFMLAATIVHNSMQGTLETCYLIGGFIFIMAIGAVYIFFKKQIYKKTYLPIILMMYAFVSIFVIISGRIYTYGFETLGSSRYVVETTIGVMGVIQIYWYDISNEKNTNSITNVVCIVSMVGAILFANNVEEKIGPYRKIYNDNMIYLAENIDEATDDELAIFQAPPEDVRELVQFMKENHLCIWK